MDENFNGLTEQEIIGMFPDIIESGALIAASKVCGNGGSVCCRGGMNACCFPNGTYYTDGGPCN